MVALHSALQGASTWRQPQASNVHAASASGRQVGPAVAPVVARPPFPHCPGEASTSGRRHAVTCAAGDVNYGSAPGPMGSGQFSEFREFQRQAANAALREQAGGQGPAGAGGAQAARWRPYSKGYWSRLPNAWFAKPEYTPASLYEEIVARCEKNTCGADALYMMCKLATSPEEARTALAAFAAVRASLVRQGRVEPYSPNLAVAFLRMIRAADAPDVLVEALRRATELGLLLSMTRVHELLRGWGDAGELAWIEEVVAAMPLGGIPYNHVTAYIVIRTAVNQGAQEKAEYYASAMIQRQVRLTASTKRLLEAGRERQRLQRMQAAAAAQQAQQAQQQAGPGPAEGEME